MNYFSSNKTQLEHPDKLVNDFTFKLIDNDN